MNSKVTLILGIFALCLTSQAQVAKTMLRLPDTGQVADFSTQFGEDSDYLINPPVFKDNGDGTVTDTVTGLMWQSDDGGEMTFESAVTYCDTLKLAGFSDWRLPAAKESYSIQNLSFNRPSLDIRYFSKNSAEYWWTSDRQSGNTNKVWVTNAGGGIGNHPKNETISAGGSKHFHARAVRSIDPPVQLKQRFINFGNILYDSLSMLQWASELDPDSMTWTEALLRAESSAYGGYTDWRLPNAKELQSLTDEKLINPCMNDLYYTNLSVATFWTSTTLQNQPEKAWIMDNRFGIMTYRDKIFKSRMIMVRTPGQQNSSIAVTPPDHLFVFPNPFTDRITLTAPDANRQVILQDSYGRFIYRGNNVGQQDFAMLPQGCYFLSCGNILTRIRIIKQ